MSDVYVLIVAGLGAVAATAWLITLTVAVIRLHERSGEPVYRQLGNGRIRFSWGVAQAYVSVRSRPCVPPDDDMATSPLPAMHVGDGTRSSQHG